MKTPRSAKAATDSIIGGFCEDALILESNQSGYSAFDFNLNAEHFQSNLTTHLVQHKTIRLKVRCVACEKPKSPLKMSAIPSICRACVKDLRGKGAAARSNFIERAKSNLGKFLRRGVENVR